MLDWFKRSKPTPADPDTARQYLGGLARFADLPDATLNRLAASALDERVDAGRDVIVEGRFPSGFYVVIEGELDVLASSEPGAPAVKVNAMGSGDHFGEVGLIEGMPATATVRAKTECRLLKIPGRDLLAALDDSRGSINAFLEEISGAMARTDPTYRLAADAAAGKPTEAAGAAELRHLAALASEVGPVLRPTGHEDLLDRIAVAARRVLEAAACSIALAEEGELVFRGVSGEGAETIRGLRLGLDQGITGGVFTSGEAVLVDDVAADPRFDKAFASSTGYVPESLHAIRLETARGPIGVLQVLDAARLSDDSGIEVLEAFAGLAALTITTDAVFANLGRAIFHAAAEALEGTGIEAALSEAARSAPAGAEKPATSLAVLEALHDADEGSVREVLELLRSKKGD